MRKFSVVLRSSTKALNRFRLILICICAMNLNSSWGQPPWEWARDGDAVENSDGKDSFVDASGNSYFVGRFTGSVDFGGTILTSTTPTDYDGYIAKYDPLGTLIWVSQITSSSPVTVYGITLDASGNIYVCGDYQGDATFYNTTGNITLLADGGYDAFIARYDPAGDVVWANPGLGNNDAHCFDIAVDATNVYVTGAFRVQCDWDPAVGPGIGGTGQDEIFVVKHQLDGTFDWQIAAGSNTADFGYGIAVDGSGVYVCGLYGNNNATFTSSGPDIVLTNIGEDDAFVAKFDLVNGDVLWAKSGGSVGGSESANGIVLVDGTLFTTGHFENTSSFGALNVSSNGLTDIFYLQYDLSGTEMQIFSDGGTAADTAYDISADALSNIYVTGSFSSSVDFGGGGSISAIGAQDGFLLRYQTDGTFSWVQKISGGGIERGFGVDASDDGTVGCAGLFNGGDVTFITAPATPPHTWDGGNDFFHAYLNYCQGPEITACQSDVTVLADAACNHTLGDYTGSIVATDWCSSGLSYSQEPVAGTVLTAGSYPINLIAIDGSGYSDTCTFIINIEANVNPTLVECGDIFLGETTFGSGDNGDGFSCSTTATPGEDVYYQINVPSGNYLMGVTMSNVSDINDPDVNVFWVGDDCPIGSGCLSEDQFNIADQDFDSNGQDQILFNAVGPGTYYFVVDSETDGIDTYDIQFECIMSGVEFDTTGCGLDTDADGLYVTIDGLTDMTVEPCQSSTFCHRLYLQNQNGGEWLDTVVMDLGPCYTNVTNVVPDLPGPNGFYDAGGTWNATYTAATNSIEWGFDYSGPELLGDGVGSLYNCLSYQFCFDADITAGCESEDSLIIEILITDDGVPGAATWAVPGFDYVVSNDFVLNIPSPGFEYGTTTFCPDDPDPIPSIDEPGGLFTIIPGLIINSTTGEIDLSASTPGSYDVTYSVGACPFDSIIPISIVDYDVVNTLDYFSGPFCSTSPDPVPTLGAGTTPGGTFSSTPAGLVIDGGTGVVDLASSSAGTYTIKYLTSGPCPDSISIVFDLVMLPDIDPVFWLPDTICLAEDIINLGDSTSLNPGETHYFYSYGPSGSATLSGAANEELDANTSGSGLYFITHVVDNGVCDDSLTQQVVIMPVYNAANILPDTLCEANDTINLNDYFDLTTTLGGTWDVPGIFEDSLWIVEGYGGSSFTIEYIVGIGQCTDSSYSDVFISPDYDTSWTMTSEVCLNSDTIDLTSLVLGDAGGVFTGDGVLSNTFYPELADTGSHLIVYYIGEGVCLESLGQTINVLESPIAYAGTDSVVCGLSIQLNAYSNLDSSYWLSSVDATIEDTMMSNSNASVNSQGDYYFIWTAHQDDVCSASDTVMITFFEEPIAYAGPDQLLEFVYDTYLDADIPSGEGIWNMISGSGMIWDTLNPATYIEQLEVGLTELSWTVTNGICPSSTDTLFITVKDIFIPEALTPNGDGKNETFLIKGIEDKSNSVQIFNRWGQLVFEAKNYDNSWAGDDMSGNPLENDTYFYVIEVFDQKYNGYLILKRE